MKLKRIYSFFLEIFFRATKASKPMKVASNSDRISKGRARPHKPPETFVVRQLTRAVPRSVE